MQKTLCGPQWRAKVNARRGGFRPVCLWWGLYCRGAPLFSLTDMKNAKMKVRFQQRIHRLQREAVVLSEASSALSIAVLNKLEMIRQQAYTSRCRFSNLTFRGERLQLYHFLFLRTVIVFPLLQADDYNKHEGTGLGGFVEEEKLESFRRDDQPAEASDAAVFFISG